MSFAFSAALFDDNNDSDFLNNKRKHNKTQKNYKTVKPSFKIFNQPDIES